MSLRAYPRFSNDCTFPLECLCDMIEDGELDTFIMHEFKNIDQYPLGCFGMDLTTPHNDFVIQILVDLNVIKGESEQDLYKLRVEHLASDGFIDIKTDLESVKKAVEAIMSGNIPLHNVTKNIDVTVYDYIVIE